MSDALVGHDLINAIKNADPNTKEFLIRSLLVEEPVLMQWVTKEADRAASVFPDPEVKGQVVLTIKYVTAMTLLAHKFGVASAWSNRRPAQNINDLIDQFMNGMLDESAYNDLTTEAGRLARQRFEEFTAGMKNTVLRKKTKVPSLKEVLLPKGPTERTCEE
jgi:hypothetical protein